MLSLADRIRLAAFDAALDQDTELWAALSWAASAHEARDPRDVGCRAEFPAFRASGMPAVAGQALAPMVPSGLAVLVVVMD